MFPNLSVTDVSLSRSYNRNPRRLYPPSLSRRRTSLQILLSNLNVTRRSYRVKPSAEKSVKRDETHLSVTGASLFLLYSRIPKQLCPPSPSPPRTFLRIPLRSLVDMRWKWKIKQVWRKTCKFLRRRLTFLWLMLLCLAFIVVPQSRLVHFFLLHAVFPSESLWVIYKQISC